MEITQGCVNVQLLVQHIVRPSVRVVTTNKTVKLQEWNWRGHSVVHSFGKFLQILSATYAAFRIMALFRHWKEGNNVEQLCLTTLQFALANMPLGASSILEDKSNDYCFVITECLKLTKFQWLGYPSAKRHLSFLESAVYLFSSGTFTTPVLYQITVFVIDHHPLKLAAQWLHLPKTALSDILIAIFSSVVYDCASVHGTGSFFYVLLGMVSFIEVMHTVSFQLLDRHNVLCFTSKLRLYRIMYILIQTGNGIADRFLQRLVVMGILAASCSGYVIIKLYGELSIMIYLIISAIFPMIMLATFAMVTLAAIPESNAAKFKQLWKWELMKRSDLIRLRSCPPMGYCFGFVHNCKRGTALSIADVTVNLVATLTLLRV